MKTFALFVSVLVGILAARKISEADSKGFADAVQDALQQVENTAKDIAAPVLTAFGTKYDALIKSSAEANGLDPAVLYRLLYQESRFRDDIITGKVRSRVGALGIAQFMPATAVQELGSVEAALDPAKAIPGAARYLAKQIRATGSLVGGVAAYNWGIGNVQRKGLANAPKETREYVAAILPGQSIG
jgi:soluble lytic murein transglycosylase-like protein